MQEAKQVSKENDPITLPMNNQKSHNSVPKVFDEQIKRLYDQQMLPYRKYESKAQFFEEHKNWFAQHKLRNLESSTDGFQISILPLCRNLEVLNVYITFRLYKMTLTILNVDEYSENHFHQFFQGTHANVYVAKDYWQKYVVKCIKVKDNFQEKFVQALQQYFCFKIAEQFRVGPSLKNLAFFDLIVYKDCIQFTMELCEDSIVRGNNLMKQSKNNLQILHLLQIVHSDIKPANIGFSRKFQKFIFLDFGFSQVVKELPGEKSYIHFRGTLQYCSNQMRSCYLLKQKSWVDLYYNDVVCLNKSLAQIQAERKSATKKFTQESQQAAECGQDFNRMVSYEKNHFFIGLSWRRELEGSLIYWLKHTLATIHFRQQHFNCKEKSRKIEKHYKNINWSIFSEIIEFVDKMSYCHSLHHDVICLNGYFVGRNNYEHFQNKINYKMRSKSFILQKRTENANSVFQEKYKLLFSFEPKDESLLTRVFKETNLAVNQVFGGHTAFLVVLANSIAFQNIKYNNQQKLFLCSFLLEKIGLKCFNNKIYAFCIGYLYDFCAGQGLNHQKLKIIQAILVSVIVLQIKSDELIVSLLQKILKQNLQISLKLKILLRHFQALLWLNQKCYSSYIYGQFLRKTIKIVSAFCQKWPSSSQWQYQIKTIISHFIGHVGSNTNFAAYTHFYKCDASWKHAQSAAIYELLNEYVLLILGFEMQASCLTHKQLVQRFDYYQDIFLHTISLKKDQNRLQYYYVPIAKYYSTFVYEMDYAKLIVYKLRQISRIVENMWFKIEVQLEIILLVQGSQQDIKKLRFYSILEEQNKWEASSATKLWVIYSYTMIKNKKLQSNIQNTLASSSLISRVQLLYHHFITKELFLEMIKVGNHYILPHYLEQHFSMIVWILLYYHQNFQAFSSHKLQALYQRCLHLISQHGCVKCKYYCIQANSILKAISSNILPLEHIPQQPYILQRSVKKYKWSQLLAVNTRMQQYLECTAKYPNLSIQSSSMCQHSRSSLLNTLQQSHCFSILDDLHYKIVPTHIYWQAAKSFESRDFKQYMLIVKKALQVKTTDELNHEQVKDAHWHLQNIVTYLSLYGNLTYEQIFQIHEEHRLFQELKQDMGCDYAFVFMIVYQKTGNDWVDERSVMRTLTSFNFLMVYTKQQTLSMHYLKILLSKRLGRYLMVFKRQYRFIYRRLLKLDPSPLITKFRQIQSLYMKITSILMKNKKERRPQQSKLKELLVFKLNKIKAIKQIT